MVPSVPADDHAVSLLNLPAATDQCRTVFIVAAILLGAFAIAVPFASVQLPSYVSFNPVVESIVFVNDLITAILFFSNYATIRSPAILALAAGYLYTALIVIPHILTFPGAFAGLIPAGSQTSAWLYYFWSVGTPVAVIIYTLLGNADHETRTTLKSARSTIGWSAVLTICFVSGMTLLAMAADRFLPILVSKNHYSNTTVYVANPLAISITAIALVLLWFRRRSILDYWLLLAMLSLVLNFVIAAFFATQRYSLGFYASRAFTLVTSMIVLALLLTQMTNLYTRLARSNRMLAREKRNRLMNAEVTTAAIAHEIKQPLTAMVSNAQAALALLEKTPADVSEIREAVRDVIVDGIRTSDALDAIRSLFRNVDERRDLVDVNEVALEVLSTMRAQLSDHGIVARPELTAELPYIHANRGQLHEVILNLAQNAIEAMKATVNRSRMLRLMTHRDGEMIAVAVQDSGPGIDPTRLDGIFDAFETTKSQGMGLGLAICRMIIERHGGQLSVHSDGSNGALFQFVLPILRTDQHANRVEP